MMSNNPDTHVSAVFIEAGFDRVWQLITDPLNFPELYPSWTSEVNQVDDSAFEGKRPNGEPFTIRPKLNRDFGVIDFEIESSKTIERSRSRLFDVSENGCQLIHLAVRWENLDDDRWEQHVVGTEQDLERMREFIENRS